MVAKCPPGPESSGYCGHGPALSSKCRGRPHPSRLRQPAVTLDIVDPGTNGVSCQSQEGCFTPINIIVKVGTKITWMNKSKLAHTVVAAQGTDISSPKPASQIFDSKVQIPSGGSFSYTVTQAAYDFNSDTHNVLYYCSIHPDMVAQLNIVK